MTAVTYVDTHAHLDDAAFDPDRDEMLDQVAAAGVRHVINVGYRPERWQTTIALTKRFPLIKHMLGLHPHYAGEWSPEMKRLLMELVRSTSPLAVGEIGLDYLRDGPRPEVQLAAFRAQLAMAHGLSLPAVIHQRAAEEDLITVLSTLPAASQVLLHSFEGTNRLACLANDRGFYVGIGGLATRAGAAALRQTLTSIPLERIVLETDSPYLTPAGSKGRRNTPVNLPFIAERLAPIWNVDQATLAATTTQNAARLFGPRLDDGQRGPTESNP